MLSIAVLCCVQYGTTLPLKFHILDVEGNIVEELLEGISLQIEGVEAWEIGKGKDALRFDNKDYH